MRRCVSLAAAWPKHVRSYSVLFLAFLTLSTQWSIAEDASKDLTIYQDDIIFAHLADGDGWTTIITLVNLDSIDATFELFFAGNDGRDLPIPFLGLGSRTSISGTIPLRGTVTFQTAGTSVPLIEGWAIIDTRQRIGGMAVFSFKRPGIPNFEAVVPITSFLDLRQILAFDHRDGFQTGMALANFSTAQTSVVMQFRDENGVALFSDTVILQPAGHTSFLLSQRYPQLANTRGTVEFGAQPGVTGGLAVLGLRVNPQGPITTTFPMRAPTW